MWCLVCGVCVCVCSLQVLLDKLGNLRIEEPAIKPETTDDLYVFVDNSNM